MRSLRRVVVVATFLALVTSGVVGVDAGAQSSSDSSDDLIASSERTAGDRVTWSGSMQSLVPARILDTRNGTGAPARAVASGTSIEVSVVDVGGVPSTGAGAVVLNITATQSQSGGYVTVWPTGAPRPTASSLNLARGRNVANSVVAKVGRDGKVSIFNGGGATHVLADVTGWFPEGGGIEPLVPTRLLDTRDAPASPIGQRGVRTLKVTGTAGVPSSGVAAVVLNVTATLPTATSSYLSVWPTGSPRPTTSNLNFVRGQTVPNAVIAKVGTGGTISIYNDSGSTHVVVDIGGWFPEGNVEPLVPARLLDTRNGTGAAKAPVGPGGTVSFDALGRGGVPASGVAAVVLNVTATRPTTDGYLTVWPAGAARPTASSLNFDRGRTVPNLAVAKVGTGGRVSIFNYAGSTEVIADVVGWFPDASAGATTTIQPWEDSVIVGSGDVVARTGDSMVGGTLTLSASSDRPAVGDPIAAMPGGVTPEGVVGTVTAVTPGAGGTSVVAFAPTDVGSVFADFEESYDGPVGSAPPAGGQAPHVQGGEVAPQSEGGIFFNPMDGLSCGGAPVQVLPLDLDMNDANVDWDIDLSERRVRFVMGVTPTLTATVKTTGAFSCSVSVETPPLMLGNVWITPSLGMELSGSYNGTFTGTASAPVTVGFEYDDGGRNLSSADLRGSANFTSSANGSVGLSSGAGLEISLLGRVGIDSSFDIGVTGQLDTAKNPCITVELAPTIGFAVTVDLWLADWEFDIAEFTGTPVTLYSANPSPPCTDRIYWTGVVTLDWKGEDWYGSYSKTIEMRPRARPSTYNPVYQAAAISGVYDQRSPCTGTPSPSSSSVGVWEGSYEDAHTADGISYRGGVFQLTLPGFWGSTRIAPLWMSEGVVQLSGWNCDGSTYSMLGSLTPGRNGLGVDDKLCDRVLSEGIDFELAAGGSEYSLEGSHSEARTWLIGSHLVESCSVTWRLTRLADRDGDGRPD